MKKTRKILQILETYQNITHTHCFVIWWYYFARFEFKTTNFGSLYSD